MIERDAAYFKIINHKNDAGETALHIAVKYATINNINLLLQCGADFTLQNTIGETALHYAAKNDQI